MNHQFTIQFTEEHIKYASRKFFFRAFLKTILLSCLSIGIIFAVCCGSRQWDWTIGVPIGMLAIMAVFLFSFYIRMAQKPLARFKQYGGTIGYDFSEDSFKSKSGWASAEFKWEVFKAVWIFPKAWLLLSRDGGYFTFPVEQTSNEVREFLKQKISSVGGLVK